MDNDGFNGFLALQTHPIIERLSQIRNISKREALDLFYNSNFYNVYANETTKLWHFSHITLADLLNQEISSGYIEFPVEG